MKFYGLYDYLILKGWFGHSVMRMEVLHLNLWWMLHSKNSPALQLWLPVALLTPFSLLQEWNFTAATVGRKGIGDSTARHWGIVQEQGISSDVVCVGKGDTISEPATFHGLVNHQKKGIQGTSTAAYAVKEAIIVGHVPMGLGKKQAIQLQARAHKHLGGGHIPAVFAWKKDIILEHVPIDWIPWNYDEIADGTNTLNFWFCKFFC